MKKLKIKLISTLLFFNCYTTFGQIGEYNFKRELKGISEQWHRIYLPEDVFGKISNDLKDIRIYGITAKNDTIETPYILRIATDNVIRKDIAFTTHNVTRNNKGHYFTFEVPTLETINQIKLTFKQNNFDWRVKLEGSQNQNDWFTIIANYRILSIKNEVTNFQFTKLLFSNSKYRFFRLQIEGNEIPELTSAVLEKEETTKGELRDYSVKKIDLKENRKSLQTEIDVELKMPVPVSCVKFVINDSFDYYRPITIKYLTDSIKTERGWEYNYSTLATETLNSIEKNEFKFSSTIVQRLKILIHNQNNQPLTLDKVLVKGYVHELVARFTEQATYFLVYGNKNAPRPNYDISHFSDKVPKLPITLELGEELTIEKVKALETEPIFKNKFSLWLIMITIILVLGWFSLKMMRKE